MTKKLNQRKLSLSTSTIRALGGAALRGAAGGYSAKMCDPSEVTCLCGTGGSGGSASGDENCHVVSVTTC